MFCKKCGKEIDNDSIFCKHCGTLVKNDTANDPPDNEQNRIESVSKPTTPPPAKPKDADISEGRGGCLVAVIITLIIIAVFIMIGVSSDSCKACVIANEDGSGGYNPQIFSRAATNNDISIDFNYEGVIAINVDVTAKSDIKDLALTLKFTNKNGVTIKTFEKYVGNIDEGETERISIGISEFGLSEIFTIHYVEASITGGSVSYFA